MARVFKKIAALSERFEGLASKVTRIEEELFQLKFVTVISDQPGFFDGLADFLVQNGSEVSFVGTGELARIPLTRPNIVLVGQDTAASWRIHTPGNLRKIFEKYKVVGIGEGGDELFRLLDLQLSNVMHGRETNILVEAADLIANPDQE